MQNPNWKPAATILALGGSRADAARAAKVKGSTITKWFKIPEFVDYIEQIKPELADLAVSGLTDLVPKALDMLKLSLEGEGIPAARARVALDIIKAAASVNNSSKTEQGSSGNLERRLAELDGRKILGD